MASNIKTIKKLQLAINMNCPFRILYTTSQFYSVAKQMPVTKYCLRKAELDYTENRSTSEEIFSTYSQLQIILYLRDLWYTWNNMELPTDNELWNGIKEREKINYKDVIG
jgi:hypothetical protein